MPRLCLNPYKQDSVDAKTLFEAIQARFGGNDATKKTHRTLLKQMYNNFNAPSTDLPSEWNPHVVVWRNEANLDTMSMDDLYNNFKIVEQEIKRTVTSCSSSGPQNMAFLSSLGSTNEVDSASIQVSTFSTPVSIVRNAEVLGTKKAGQGIKTAQDRLNVEDTSSKAIVAIDGAGLDWSYMADDEVPTNMALMAFSDS
nr:hypothetical protein [Tanacetum cinerariifolium]